MRVTLCDKCRKDISDGSQGILTIDVKGTDYGGWKSVMDLCHDCALKFLQDYYGPEGK